MSEQYEAPKAEYVKFNAMDVICTSGCTCIYEDTNGHSEYNEYNK